MKGENMEKVWIPDYPDAEAKVRTYKYVIDALNEQKVIIEEVVDLESASGLDKYRDSSLKGAYYSKYADSVFAWEMNVQKYKTQLKYFLDNLREKIEHTQQLCDAWEKRKNMGHFEGEYYE